GASPEDHHCWKLPVLAAADGVVVAIEDGVPDNAIGDVELRKNWGNVVVLQHAPGLFSLVAHLACGSVRVRPGQSVRRGEVLGPCGSWGRWPRPHLHFQLQSSRELGAPTLPCRFSDAVVRSGAERLVLAIAPAEGQTIRNVEAEPELARAFAFERGRTIAL